MSAINNGMRRALKDQVFRGSGLLIDDLVSAANATQTAAVPLTGAFHRVTAGAANSSFIMKSMLSKEAPNIVVVINDGANSVNVYPAVGDTMNGVANAAQAVGAGATGIFVRTNESDTLDWRANTIT
jgi:hypothetical protein